MYIHEKFQGFSSKNDLVIAVGLLKFGMTGVGGMSIYRVQYTGSF